MRGLLQDTTDALLEQCPLGSLASSSVPGTEEEQINLFLRLFRCRESVYPKFWENPAKGIRGYSPVCANEWIRDLCGKPPLGRTKCSDCPNQGFRKLDEAAVRQHLLGQNSIGTYAIREDDTCIFLACDFDGEGWRSDAFDYQSVARTNGVDVLVERSRSGCGAHAWIFFSEPVPARQARLPGTYFLSKCCEENHRLELATFDRFFPNQDYLPKGGFGNLIALPLQGERREFGNTVFIRPTLEPERDQWAVLASVRQLSATNLRSLLDRVLPKVRIVRGQEEDAGLMRDAAAFGVKADVRGALPRGFEVTMELAAQVTIPLTGLQSRLVAALKAVSSFPNPEFYKLQRMRMQTYPHPRFIFSGELRESEVVLPRGDIDKAVNLLKKAGASVQILDRRGKGEALDVAFRGTLTAQQSTATATLLRHDQGVLVATPGTGKTVIACAILAERKVSTLVLLHRQPLLEQWIERFETFLGIDPKQMGVVRGTKKKRTGILDIAMLQSLTKLDDLETLARDYGMVIIDECHHVPASSFESVMKSLACKYVLGLTATPKRKDGLERLLYQQCGPIRCDLGVIEGAQLTKRVVFRETGLRLPEELGQRPPYHLIAHLIAIDERRNRLIVSDILQAITNGRFPMVIADRKAQIETLSNMLGAALVDQDVRTFHLEGSMSPNQRRAVLKSLNAARSTDESCVLFATASLVGEGFDLPGLDTLVLASPVSFEGRLVQYVGRLHRSAEGKEEILVHDYMETSLAVSLSMYRNRLKTYRKMGYEIESPEGLLSGSQTQTSLFG